MSRWDITECVIYNKRQSASFIAAVVIVDASHVSAFNTSEFNACSRDEALVVV